MNPRQAALIIGCSPQQVRTLIRAGKLRATKVRSVYNRHGYVYRLNPLSVRSYAKAPQRVGFPRGKKRS